jgi:hypothetical protein
VAQRGGLADSKRSQKDMPMTGAMADKSGSFYGFVSRVIFVLHGPGLIESDAPPTAFNFEHQER